MSQDVLSDEDLATKQSQEQETSPPPIPKSQLGRMITFDEGVKAVTWKGNGQLAHNEPGKFVFKILEVLVTDDRGDEVPAFTIGQYVIAGDQRTKWTSYNTTVLYYVREGEAWFNIGEDGKVLRAGYWLSVKKNQRHNIQNKSAFVQCKVDLIFPGKILLKRD